MNRLKGNFSVNIMFLTLHSISEMNLLDNDLCNPFRLRLKKSNDDWTLPPYEL